MIHKCNEKDFEAIYKIINDAAQAYKRVIPNDCWEEPYMPKEKIRHEIDAGVEFWGYIEKDEIVGVMGIQHVKNVTLIRHAYVYASKQNQGVGSKLLNFLRKQTNNSMLVGTWKDAVWAVHFYEKHGFRLVSQEEKNRLLRKYWSVPERQIETSVVLVDHEWFEQQKE